MIDLLKEPSGLFENCCRLSAQDFELLLQKIGKCKRSAGFSAQDFELLLQPALSRLHTCVLCHNTKHVRRSPPNVWMGTRLVLCV